MSSIPIRNGVVVHFPEYGNQFARVDLYRINNVYIFWGPMFYGPQDEEGGRTVDIEVTLRGNTLSKKINGYDGWIVPKENVKFKNQELALASIDSTDHE